MARQRKRNRRFPLRRKTKGEIVLARHEAMMKHHTDEKGRVAPAQSKVAKAMRPASDIPKRVPAPKPGKKGK